MEGRLAAPPDVTHPGTTGLFAGAMGELLLGPGKPFALLTYIALSPGRCTSRESLIDVLWSDVDQDRARNALRQTLDQLRRLLGDDALTGSEEVTHECSIDVDRDAFLARSTRMNTRSRWSLIAVRSFRRLACRAA